MQQLHVDILVEGAGEAIAGGGDHTPAPAVLSRERDGRVVSGVAETKERQFLE
jgi:hypothetical protein